MYIGIAVAAVLLFTVLILMRPLYWYSLYSYCYGRCICIYCIGIDIAAVLVFTVLV